MKCPECTEQAEERKGWAVTMTFTPTGVDCNTTPIGGDVCEDCYEREERKALGDLARMMEF